VIRKDSANKPIAVSTAIIAGNRDNMVLKAISAANPNSLVSIVLAKVFFNVRHFR
jgi:hypothetical protein